MVMSGGGSCGSCGGRMVVIVVVIMVVVGPVYCQTHNRGFFQLYKSCEREVRLQYLPVNELMWLRSEAEVVSLTSSKNATRTCHLLPNTTNHVSVGNHLEVHVAGATGEDTHSCIFPKHTIFVLPRGLLMVSCHSNKSQAEAEMLGAHQSSSGVVSSVAPQPRALDLSIQNTPRDASTTLHAPSTQEPLPPSTTLEPLANSTSRGSPSPTRTTGGVILTTTPLGAAAQPEYSKTIMNVTGRVSSTKPPSVTDGSITSPGKTTMVSDHWSENVTKDEGSEETSAKPDSNSTQQPSLTKTLPSTGNESGVEKANISAWEPEIIENSLQKDDHMSGQPNDQITYLAGTGAAVLALLVGVVAVVSVVHYRSRQAKAKERQKSDLFISGGYKGSMNSLTHSDSQGAYLNAHVMYSGADPEFAESFEMDRIIDSKSSYSSHDVPRCLREH